METDIVGSLWAHGAAGPPWGPLHPPCELVHWLHCAGQQHQGLRAVLNVFLTHQGNLPYTGEASEQTPRDICYRSRRFHF